MLRVCVEDGDALVLGLAVGLRVPLALAVAELDAVRPLLDVPDTLVVPLELGVTLPDGETVTLRVCA